AGDHSHIPADEESVKKLVQEELRKESFTAVVITGIKQDHIAYMKAHFKHWCRQLAHIYHYYIHGPRGNDEPVGRGTTASPFRNIDIQVVLFEKGKQPKRTELRDINDDMQTQYIRTAASVFEFRAKAENGGVVEGVLRYHPFLYDRETYPTLDGEIPVVETVEEFGEPVEKDSRAPRGNRPVFECYWNGRLIPYTYIDVLEWCQPPKKITIPMECYNSVTGVCFLPCHVGALGRVARISQPWEAGCQKWKLLGITGTQPPLSNAVVNFILRPLLKLPVAAFLSHVHCMASARSTQAINLQPVEHGSLNKILHNDTSLAV
ncbi:unnamed protein product, partial [Porites evermanni]